MAEPERLATPYFSGGTGRSGTTVIAKLLTRHPELGRTVPWEARFLTDPYGLCDLVEGRSAGGLRAVARSRTRVDEYLFARRLRGRWFRRTAGNGQPRGLHLGVDERTVDRALDGFGARLRADPGAAAARLTHELLDPPTRRGGKPRWIDTTPGNAWRADGLLLIFPDLRLVHMVRDGRDVAASVAARYWGPDDPDAALVWWEERMRRIGRALSAVPPRQVLTVQLEDLVLRRRAETLARVLDFLDLPPAPAVQAYFDEQMQPDRAHLQRWDAGLDADRRRAVTRRYEQALERLAAEGCPIPH